MITDLRDMMEERLLAYRTKNRDLPQRILVYRDGVSEVRPMISSSSAPSNVTSFRANSLSSLMTKSQKFERLSESLTPPKVSIAPSCLLLFVARGIIPDSTPRRPPTQITTEIQSRVQLSIVVSPPSMSTTSSSKLMVDCKERLAQLTTTLSVMRWT
jgi:Piwi domain